MITNFVSLRKHSFDDCVCTPGIQDAIEKQEFVRNFQEVPTTTASVTETYC